MPHLNITPIDIAYILSALTGFLFSIHALPHYHFSLRAARTVEIPEDRRDAIHLNQGTLIREYVRLSIHILGLAVGIGALFLIPEYYLNQPLYDHYFGFAVVIVLLWANIGTTINTIFGWMEWTTVRKRKILSDSLISDLRRRIRRVEDGDWTE